MVSLNNLLLALRAFIVGFTQAGIGAMLIIAPAMFAYSLWGLVGVYITCISVAFTFSVFVLGLDYYNKHKDNNDGTLTLPGQ